MGQLRFSDPLVSACFAAVFFSALLCLALATTGRRKASNNFPTTSQLPSMIAGLVPNLTTLKPFIGPVPWNTQRKSLSCVLPTCSSGSAYVASLPVLSYGTANAWSKDLNTWHLSTQEHFRTGWPNDYTVATVLVVPANTPDHVKFLVDERFSDNAFVGLKPLITATNELLDMGPNWNNGLVLSPPQGRNLTGNYAHSFVLHNTALHEVYFAKMQMTAASAQARADWWACPPGSWTLFWPSDVYFSGILKTNSWLAHQLPANTTNDFAAYVAETMMYSFLAPKAPVVS
jgi:hypothetical protein